jgi:hypothetical protein
MDEVTLKYLCKWSMSPFTHVGKSYHNCYITLIQCGFKPHPLLLLYNRQQKADGVKQDWTNPPPAHPTGRPAWELRTPTLLRCERFLRTVPQACPTVLSKACRAVSAVTGTQPRASSVRSPVSAIGGSHASIGYTQYTQELTGAKTNTMGYS